MNIMTTKMLSLKLELNKIIYSRLDIIYNVIFRYVTCKLKLSHSVIWNR